MATVSVSPPTTDPVTRFLTRFGVRDVGHFIFAYAAAVVPLLNWTSFTTLKATAIAAIPAGATVLFRQVFPHRSASVRELATAVAAVATVVEKAQVAPAPAAPAPAPAAPVA